MHGATRVLRPGRGAVGQHSIFASVHSRNYRRLYARTLAAGINHFNQSLIIANLLATGRDTPPDFKQEEGALIAAAMRKLPPPRAYKVLGMLRLWRVNNRRARAIARDYVRSRDVPFDAVKYRAKLRSAVAHGHLALGQDVGRFLFGGYRAKPTFDTPMLELFRQAHFDSAKVFELPFTVAEGLAHKHGIARDKQLSRGEATMTATEKMRSADKVDPSRMPLTRLALYVLSLDRSVRAERLDELQEAFTNAAARALRRHPGFLRSERR